jgi:hypothetical protein
VRRKAEFQRRLSRLGCIEPLLMWSRLLALVLLLLPAPALAEVKENVSALAPSGLVLVVDGKGSACSTCAEAAILS